MPDVKYNQYEVEKLRDFLLQEHVVDNFTKQNGVRLNERFNHTNPKTFEVKWKVIDGEYHVTEIDWGTFGLSGELDLTDFVYLESFICSCCKVHSITLKGCYRLKFVRCFYNQLKKLNLTGCTALEYLNCCGNKLKSLNLRNLTALKELWCEYNEIKNLNLSNLVNLIRLRCESNKLSVLDANNCTELIRLVCDKNKIEKLDVQNCSNLMGLEIPEGIKELLLPKDCVCERPRKSDTKVVWYKQPSGLSFNVRYFPN